MNKLFLVGALILSIGSLQAIRSEPTFSYSFDQDKECYVVTRTQEASSSSTPASITYKVEYYVNTLRVDQTAQEAWLQSMNSSNYSELEKSFVVIEEATDTTIMPKLTAECIYSKNGIIMLKEIYEVRAYKLDFFTRHTDAEKIYWTMCINYNSLLKS
jgi:hypothetical protein